MATGYSFATPSPVSIEVPLLLLPWPPKIADGTALGDALAEIPFLMPYLWLTAFVIVFSVALLPLLVAGLYARSQSWGTQFAWLNLAIPLVVIALDTCTGRPILGHLVTSPVFDALAAALFVALACATGLVELLGNASSRNFIALSASFALAAGVGLCLANGANPVGL